jgi:uncharacterized membrane protein YeaQ/YmgE (transglycosylase-associated protein family)
MVGIFFAMFCAPADIGAPTCASAQKAARHAASMPAMEILFWVGAGAVLGWLSYAFLGFNEARGLTVSIAIGAIGALVGAKGLAPMFITTAAPLDGLSVPFLMFAVGTAVVCLVLGNMLYRRWDI